MEWKVCLLVLEVGCRGWVPRRFGDSLRKLGMEWSRVKELSNAVIDQARKASYVIFINRFNQNFQSWGTA